MQEKRISIEGIKQHPWYTKPLPAKYAKQLATMAAAQAKIDASAHDGKNRSAERDRALKVTTAALLLIFGLESVAFYWNWW